MSIIRFRLLIIVAFWLAFPFPVSAIDYGFRSIVRYTSHHIDRPGQYDYAPTALADNNSIQVWHCGGGEGFYDSIYRTQFDSDLFKTSSTTRVLTSRSTDSSPDGMHACAPTVVKQGFGLIQNGREMYKMYYECAPRVYDRATGQQRECFTQICHAVSDDGITWKKYNQDLWSREFRYGDAATEPSAVIKIGSQIKSNINFGTENNKYYASFTGAKTCNDLAANYGVGHHSAVVINGEVWLWYFDSSGDFSKRSVYLVKSQDGFHFGSPQKTNLYTVPDVKYTGSTFIGTFNLGWENYFGYSYDGITWNFPDYDAAYNRHRQLGETDAQARINLHLDLAPYKIGLADPKQCGAPAQPSIIGDKQGWINFTDIRIFSSEGYMGRSDGCTQGDCRCYHPDEDRKRGATWGINLILGSFNNTYLIPSPTAAPSLKPTATPTLKPTVTPTLKPTATPSLKPSATPTLKPTAASIPAKCTPCSDPAAKLKGDADCDNRITLADFEYWRSEAISQNGLSGLAKSGWRSDFNCDSYVNLTDFEFWRRSFVD